MKGRDQTLAVALLFPDLLGTYGDAGNATVLAQRLRWRGFDAQVLEVLSGEAVPESCDFYVMGGGEDLPQALAARQLGAGQLGATQLDLRQGTSRQGPGPLHKAVTRGAAVLATCAGLQILGTSFAGPDGNEIAGLGLLDCRTSGRMTKRAVGEIVVDPDPALRLGKALLSGYENHAGATTLGPGARPVGRVLKGVGNGAGTPADGAWSGRVLGTYLHGPVLARNPALADRILSWVVGDLEPIDDSEAAQLRSERLAASGVRLH
jgi:CobQ-like glutamine amidotransferase family enzyme